MDKNHYLDVVFLYQRNNAPKCWILILFWITLCWISWPIYHLGIKARAVFKSTETGQFKNAQDSFPRPPGSWEIARTKVGKGLLDTLHKYNSYISWVPSLHLPYQIYNNGRFLLLYDWQVMISFASLTIR